MRLFAVLVAVVLAASPLQARAASSGSSSPDPSTPFGQGKAAVEKGEFAAALPHLQEAVDGDPDNADAWNLLGFARRKSGDLASAEQAYDRALALDDEHTGALEYLGMLYVETGRFDAARALLARIDDACFFGCDEYDELKRAIESGRPE